MFFPPGKVGQSLQQQTRHAYTWRLDRQLQSMDFGPLLIVTLLLCLAFASLSRSPLCSYDFVPSVMFTMHQFRYCISCFVCHSVFLFSSICVRIAAKKVATKRKLEIIRKVFALNKKTGVKFWRKQGLGNDFLDHRNYTTLTQLPRDLTWPNEKQSLQMSRLHHAATVLRFG